MVQHVESARRYWEALPRKLPADFAELSEAEQLAALLRGSLSQAYEVCHWDVNTLPAFRLSIWNAVRHDLWNLAFRAGLEDKRSAERERVLAALVADLPRRSRGSEKKAL